MFGRDKYVLLFFGSLGTAIITIDAVRLNVIFEGAPILSHKAFDIDSRQMGRLRWTSRQPTVRLGPPTSFQF